MNLTRDELKILETLLARRLRYEKRRAIPLDENGHDPQAYKISYLTQLLEKLQEMKLAL